MTRAIVILLAIVTGIHGVLPAAGVSVFCLGHAHESDTPDPCASQCGHAEGWPSPLPEDDHSERCDCTDVKVLTAEGLALSRDTAIGAAPTPAPQAVWTAAPILPILSRAPPGAAPPWDDPGKDFRLTIVRSNRLLI